MSPSRLEETSESSLRVASDATSKKSASGPDFEIFRRFTPITQNYTYLNASFAPPSNLIVHEAITRYSGEALTNPLPKPGWQQAAQDVRELVARYIHADESSIAFTRDTTEGLNCFIHALKFAPGDNVVILDSEHPNHAYGWLSRRPAGIEVRQVPTMAAAEKSGEVVAANAATFAPYVDERTRAIGLSSVMFHSGQWNDVADICAAYRARGIHVLVDCTQQVGFADIDVTAWGVSAVAFGFHKGLHCPTGLAALYVDPAVIKELDPTPPIVGFGAVSNVHANLLAPSDPIVYHPTARRFDHLNISLIAAAAAKAFLPFYLDVMGPENTERHLFKLGDSLRIECESLGVPIVGPKNHKYHAPHLYVLDLHDERWIPLLKENNIIVTPYRLGIRVSLGFYNNLADIKKLAKVLKSGLESGVPITSWWKSS